MGLDKKVMEEIRSSVLVILYGDCNERYVELEPKTHEENIRNAIRVVEGYIDEKYTWLVKRLVDYKMLDQAVAYLIEGCGDFVRANKLPYGTALPFRRLRFDPERNIYRVMDDPKAPKMNATDNLAEIL